MKQQQSKEQNKKHKKNDKIKESVQEVKYQIPWWLKIILLLTLPVWIIPKLLINIILGKKIYDYLEYFPKSGIADDLKYPNIELNTLAYYNHDMELKKASKKLLISDKEWDKLKPEDIKITSFDNTNLATFLFINNKKPTNKWIIVLHGWMQNRYSILYLAKPFYEAGYNVLVYDARNHGNSDITATTFGKNEARDLLAVIKYLKHRYKENILEYALIGNSMGASTVLQGLVTLPLKDYGVKSAIFDCGYDDFGHMVKILGQRNLKINWFWFYFGLKFWFFHYDKFNMNDVRPIREINNCAETPVLFIHGTLDQTVPITMTKRLYQAKVEGENATQRQGFSQLLIVEGAGHIEAITTDYELYTSTVLKFVKRWFSNDKGK